MSKRINELTALNSPSPLDLIPIVDISEASARQTKKITVQALLDSVSGADGESVGDGYDVFKEVSGTTLRFRTVTGGTGITIAENTNDIEVSISSLPTVTTADDTPTYVTLATLSEGDVKQIDVIAKVASSDGSVRQTFKLTGIYYGAGGPTATQDSYTAIPTGTGSADVAIGVTGAIVRLQITGIIATDLVTTYNASII